MERIQYAIAKARAERATQVETPGALAPPPPSPAGGIRRPTAPRPPANGTATSDLPVANGAAKAAAEDAASFMDTARSEEQIAAAWRDLAALNVAKRHAVRNRLVSLAGGTGAAEMDGIRTRLLQHAAAKGLRRIAITSPTPSCGKSTVAINLGFSLGRQADQRTIVADLDLRRPHMHKALGVKERHSFARVLQGETTFPENALRHGQTLAFATTHETVRHPAELLQSRRTAQTLTAIETDFAPTVMLFDLPPLQVSDDAMAFLSHVDAALIVAAAGRTKIKEIDRTEREVASQTKVLGVILNSCRYMDGTDGYGAYYS